MDDDGNTPLHYVARYDPGLVEAVFQVVGEGWRPCCLARNNHGQLPVDMLSPEVEDLDEATAAHADRVGESAPKGSSPAAVEERERLERRAKERAESSRVGAERIRQITRYALKEEEKRRVLTRRTFDAAGCAPGHGGHGRLVRRRVGGVVDGGVGSVGVVMWRVLRDGDQSLVVSRAAGAGGGVRPTSGWP